MKTIHVLVSGSVHGVGFRNFTVRCAQDCNIYGFVKNVPDGVEIIAEGDEKNIQTFLEHIKKGPPRASVKHVATQTLPHQGFDSFNLLF